MLTEKLMTLRKEKGLSQSELAERLNVSRQAVSRWETGDAAPGIENLKALRDLYGVTIDYLLSDEETPIPTPEPAPAAAQSAPAPVRPRRFSWAWFVIALLIVALAVSVAVVVRPLLTRRTQEAPAPKDAYNGPSPIHGEDGPIEGRGLRGYEEYGLDLLSVERRANGAGKRSVAVLSAVDSLTVSATGYSEGRSAAGFVLEAGESVIVKGAYAQFSESVKVGLLDENGVFYGIEGTSGLFNAAFKTKESGTYTFAVVNNSSAPVSVNGYVCFWMFT